MTIKAEELEKNLQRKCEEIEVLRLIIEEKENMDTTKAEEVDSEHLYAVSDDKECDNNGSICSRLYVV